MENEEESEIDKREEDNSKIDESENEEEQEEENEEEIVEDIEKEDSEYSYEELKNEKDLVEHAAEAVEHLSSETAKELDESKEIENTKKVEAALFIAGRFLTLQELVMLTDVNPLMLKEMLEKLIEKYNSEESGIEIVEKGGGWKMDVRQEHVHMINKLATGNSEFSKAEQETLAVIAYKQPVKQSVIIKIRGNKAYEHIKKFIENGLVIGKRMGHTKELRLSDDFYEYFHIRDKKVERIENIENAKTEEPIIPQEQSENEDNPGDKQNNIDIEDNMNLKNNSGEK